VRFRRPSTPTRNPVAGLRSGLGSCGCEGEEEFAVVASALGGFSRVPRCASPNRRSRRYHEALQKITNCRSRLGSYQKDSIIRIEIRTHPSPTGFKPSWRQRLARIIGSLPFESKSVAGGCANDPAVKRVTIAIVCKCACRSRLSHAPTHTFLNEIRRFPVPSFAPMHRLMGARRLHVRHAWLRRDEADTTTKRID